MTFAQGLVDALEGDAGLQAILGAGAAMRLYPLRLPQDPAKDADGKMLPALVYQRISASHAYTLDGGSRMVRARYQLAAWAGDYLAAEELGAAVIAAVSGLRTTLTSGHRVDVVKVDNDLDDYEPDTGRSRRLIDAVWHYEDN